MTTFATENALRKDGLQTQHIRKVEVRRAPAALNLESREAAFIRRRKRGAARQPRQESQLHRYQLEYRRKSHPCKGPRLDRPQDRGRLDLSEEKFLSLGLRHRSDGSLS